MMQKREFRAMGCQMLAVIDRDDEQSAAQLAAVPEWFEQWEQQFSRFRTDSDLSMLNAAGGQPMVLPEALWKVVNVALGAARESDGLVQPTLLDALEAAGYDRSFDMLDRDEKQVGVAVVTRHNRAAWRAIELDRSARTVRLPAGLRLDLGGVAKGWVADQAVRKLAASGPALVDAGGDIAVSGPMSDGSPWPIDIADPFLPDGSLGQLLLVQGAVATSGRDYRHWRRGGVEQHHIIDPRTGQPAQTDVLAATVVAPDGPSAEVAAKVVLILGSRAGLAWLEARPTLAGLLVLADGRILRSRRMDVYLDLSSVNITRANQTLVEAR
jgi:thiamine biosynthesis lipoprotein